MIAELREMLGGPILEWTPRLTALFLLAVRPWRQHEPGGTFPDMLGKVYLVLLVAALFLPTLAISAIFWILLTCIHFLWLFTAHSVADNHRYLEGYWCLALAIALWVGGEQGAQYLNWDAQYLIGLCFFFAALWKILNHSYRNGSFFVETLLFDQRFGPIALWVGGLTPNLQIRHLEAKRALLIGRLNRAQAPVPARLRRTGIFLAWWTIAMEVMLATLFLIPLSNLEPWRLAGMIFFVVTTYLLIPVPSFGQILLLMLLVTIGNVDWRIYVLGLAVSMGVLSGMAQLLERVSRRQMRKLLDASRIPRFRWTTKSAQRRLEKEGESWRLVIPSAGLSLYVPSPTVADLQRFLGTESPFVLQSQQIEFIGLLVKLGLLRPISDPS